MGGVDATYAKENLDIFPPARMLLLQAIQEQAE
jgi:hypothetical protein